MKIELFGGEDETVVEVPSKFEVCPRCRGTGAHDCWEGGMTGEEMAEQSPGFFEDYMAGMYSVTCTVCGGLRVVEVVDRVLINPDVLRRYDAAERERRDYETLVAAERRYGA